MHFETTRSAILAPMKMIAGVVERKQTLPILGNVLLRVRDGKLDLTATDSELEIAYSMPVDSGNEGDTTLPALKFFDICRSLPDDIHIQVDVGESRATIKSGRSRFNLSCLPAEDFPSSEDMESTLQLDLSQRVLKNLLNRVSYAMAQQDVRYYLNGLLFDFMAERLNVVGTDGHRLAMARADFDLGDQEPTQVILPRKTVLELAKILEDRDDAVRVSIGSSQIRFEFPNFSLTSKLIDGRFPDYQAVIPRETEKIAQIDCSPFKQALNRTAVLSSDRSKSVRLSFGNNRLTINSQNDEQEEAEEELDIEYSHEEFEIGFNPVYLLDAVNAIGEGKAEMFFSDPNSSCLMRPADNEDVKYVIMPLRL
jgi:DNA polymerase-3 subunit beta